MASSLVPNFEVKVLLNASKVLGSDNKLKDEVLSAFRIPSSTTKMNIQFVDSKERELDAKGWNLRIRKSEGEDGPQLTYKKRYPIGEGFSATAAGSIDAAADKAGQDGFDSSTSYDAQVEVGYQQQTLSLSYNVSVPNTNLQGMDLPLAEASRELLINNAPQQLRNWSADNWGTDHLRDAIIYGPVHAKRSKGKLDTMKIFVEVWPIRKSRTDVSLVPIVEASFKADNLEEALVGRTKLVDFVQSKGWFLPQDSLKTRLIMERYGEDTT
jgi:hypothetical protein